MRWLCNTLSADADQLSECSVRQSAHLSGFRQNRQVRIQNLAELHATGFLAGIVGTCGASGVHQENGRFLVGEDSIINRETAK